MCEGGGGDCSGCEGDCSECNECDCGLWYWLVHDCHCDGCHSYPNTSANKITVMKEDLVENVKELPKIIKIQPQVIKSTMI